jgi:sirohydrochlorin ferrochelatase
MRRLASEVGRRWPGPVVAAFLEFNLPSVPGVLRGLAGPAPAVPVLVPALLTRAYHGRVDVPAVLRQAGVAARVASVLGPTDSGEEPDALLLGALHRRLAELGTGYDGVAMIAAGTRDEAARETVRTSGRALGASLGVPCAVGFASSSSPTGGDAVRAVRALGATRVVVASYFLAAGQLYDTAANSALEAGALAVAAPLAGAPELADLIIKRATSAHLVS